METQLSPRIVADPDVFAGQPIVAGTHVTASALVEDIATGKRISQVARAHGVTAADVCAALEFAARRAVESVHVSPDAQQVASVTPAGQSLPPNLIAEAERYGLDPSNVSALGWRLIELQRQLLSSGEPLISSWDELDREVTDLRGEQYPDEGALYEHSSIPVCS